MESLKAIGLEIVAARSRADAEMNRRPSSCPQSALRYVTGVGASQGLAVRLGTGAGTVASRSESMALQPGAASETSLFQNQRLLQFD